jgi:hypothetical protein
MVDLVQANDDEREDDGTNDAKIRGIDPSREREHIVVSDHVYDDQDADDGPDDSQDQHDEERVRHHAKVFPDGFIA